MPAQPMRTTEARRACILVIDDEPLVVALLRPVADGAASVIWAVDLPDDGPTGGFYRDGRPLAW